MNNLYDLYAKSGFKAIKAAGYHPSLNKETDQEKRYQRAKQPITKAYTKPDYKGLTLEECAEWEATGAWIGWTIPAGVVGLDIDKEGWQQRFAIVKAICNKYGFTPPVHRTNKGVHVFFKTSAHIGGDSQGVAKEGFAVTYRAYGNQLILAPTNGRTWEIPLNGNLPEIPAELKPYDPKNKEDVLNVLAVQLGEAIRAGTLSGYDDIDTSFMSFIIEASNDEGRALELFEKVYQGDYDERLTSQMYERAAQRIKNGEAVRGAGSFIHSLKEKGLNELLRLAQMIAGKKRTHRSAG